MKPVVKYQPCTLAGIIPGYQAVVMALDHYNPDILPGDVVSTSTVLSYDEATGEFETRNTKYVLAK